VGSRDRIIALVHVPEGLELSCVAVADLDRAARHVMAGALALRPGEAVALIGDTGAVRIVDALARAGVELGAAVRVRWLEPERRRPFARLPDGLEAELRACTASVFVAAARPDELAMRQQLLAIVKERRLRHAHMPSVGPYAFVRGASVDYDVVAGVGMRILARLASTERIVATSPAGTLLLLRNEPSLRWWPQLGRLEPGRWGNLPAGALYATPSFVEGTFVADASVSGLDEPVDTRVVLTLRGGRVVGASVPDDRRGIERALRARLAAPNGDRVGLVALGVNYGIAEPTGLTLVDQNMPGLHLAIGDPAVGATGAAWTASSSLAFCQSQSTVWLDGEAVVRNGALVEAS
jgi:leucyl aminopeptidase (aminopeptidase T)